MGQNVGNFGPKTNHEHADRDISQTLKYIVIIIFPSFNDVQIRPWFFNGFSASVVSECLTPHKHVVISTAQDQCISIKCPVKIGSLKCLSDCRPAVQFCGISQMQKSNATNNFFQLKIYERGVFSVKIVYKRVRSTTTGRSLPVQNFVEYPLGAFFSRAIDSKETDHCLRGTVVLNYFAFFSFRLSFHCYNLETVIKFKGRGRQYISHCVQRLFHPRMFMSTILCCTSVLFSRALKNNKEFRF